MTEAAGSAITRPRRQALHADRAADFHQTPEFGVGGLQSCAETLRFPCRLRRGAPAWLQGLHRKAPPGERPHRTVAQGCLVSLRFCLPAHDGQSRHWRSPTSFHPIAVADLPPTSGAPGDRALSTMWWRTPRWFLRASWKPFGPRCGLVRGRHKLWWYSTSPPTEASENLRGRSLAMAANPRCAGEAGRPASQHAHSRRSSRKTTADSPANHARSMPACQPVGIGRNQVGTSKTWLQGAWSTSVTGR